MRARDVLRVLHAACSASASVKRLAVWLSVGCCFKPGPPIVDMYLVAGFFFFFFPPAELTLTTDLQTHRPCLSRVDPGAALHHRALGVPAVQSSPLRGPMTEDGSRIAMGVPTGSALHFSLGERV